MPFSGEDSDPAANETAPLLGAARLLAERGVYGLVWIDADLTVRSRYGPIVDFIEIGEPVTASVLPLFGLENELAKLREAPDKSINLPAISIFNRPEGGPRLNLLILWAADQNAYLLIVSRAVTKADLEVELSRHIRARLMAEAEVKQKSRELAHANRDLEEYAAVISHDLKAPLRAMRYLASDIEKALQSKDDAGARLMLMRLQEQSVRMSQMLTALLDYSSIGRKEEALANVDTLALITSIIRSIPHPEGMRIELHGEWPVIETLAAPLDLVLRNLVGNAIAHHDRDTGVIRVISIDSGGALEITVADDGPGIPPAQHDAIFLPFRTMHESNEPAGHGMGLSLVKRTIESVNGRIEVISNSNLQRGALFRVVWPKSNRA